MAEIVGAYFTSHVPAIGGAIPKGLQQEPIGSRSSTVIKVHEWLAQVKPDVAIVFNNDHGLNFFLTRCPLLPWARRRNITMPMKAGACLCTSPLRATPIELAHHQFSGRG
jgi:hypothetical protein